MTMLVEGLILGTTTKVASRSNTAPPAEPLPLSLRSFRQEHIIVSGEVVMCQLKGLCSQHFQGILTPVCYCQFPCGSQEASDFNSLMVDSASCVLPLIPESDT